MTGSSTTQARLQRVANPLTLIAGGSCAAYALHIRDPHTAGAWGYCPTYRLFGIYCPACGSLRAVNDLSYGNIGAAWHSNALFLVLFPAAAVLLALLVVRGWRGDPPLMSPRAQQRTVWTITVIGIAFAVVRNLPFGQVFVPV